MENPGIKAFNAFTESWSEKDRCEALSVISAISVKHLTTGVPVEADALIKMFEAAEIDTDLVMDAYAAFLSASVPTTAE